MPTGQQDWESCRAEFDRREWGAAFQNAVEYPEGFMPTLRGQLPSDLNGTYFRNGPGMFQHGVDTVAHPFDGHGLLVAIKFSHGKAFFRSRYVDTKEYREEVEAGRILFPGTFGTKPSGGVIRNLLGSLSLRNPANTGLLCWGGKCLALFEAGQPYEFCEETLKTIGVSLMSGLVQRGAPFSTGSALLDRFLGWCLLRLGIGKNMEGGFRLGGHAVSAHPAEDALGKRLAIYSYRLQLGLLAFHFFLFGFLLTIWLPGLVTKLRIHELDQDFKPVSEVNRTLPGYAFLHDLSLSAQHYVIFCNPVRLRMLPLLLGLECPAHCIEWTHQPAKIHIIRRPCSGSGVNAMDTSVAGQVRTSYRKPIRADSASEIGGRHQFVKGSEADEQQLCNQPTGLAGEDGVVNTVACASPAFVFHQSNAYCLDGRRLTVDCIRYPTMPDFKQGTEGGQTFMDSVDPELQPISQLYRYTVDLERSTTSEQLLNPRAMEFPAVNPNHAARQHRYVYTAAALHPTANGPQQAICKLDLETSTSTFWSRGLRYYCGEPIFVPKPHSGEEDAGWILCINYNAVTECSECVVLDASELSEVAMLDLGHVLPHGLHGTWKQATEAS